MTYCVGLMLNDGMVMLSDTRTNAGLDNIAVYRKTYVFENPGDPVGGCRSCAAHHAGAEGTVRRNRNDGRPHDLYECKQLCDLPGTGQDPNA